MDQKMIVGDCLEEMKKMEDNSIDFIVTDPPYGLHFMGKGWDKFNRNVYKEQKETDFKKKGGSRNVIQNANSASGSYDESLNDKFQEFIRLVGIEMLRILKPGGMLAMFGAPRRHHRQMSGLEDAGFEIRDCIAWVFGQGFPKSHNFGRKLGGEWNKFGTALKPAYEPIIIAMKPLDGTFAQNAEKWGVAGVNIDECRILSLTGQRLSDRIPEKGISEWELEKYLCNSCVKDVESKTKLKTQEIKGSFVTKNAEQILKERDNSSHIDISIMDTGCLNMCYQEERNINQKESLYTNMLKSGKTYTDQNQKDLLSITSIMTPSTIDLKICSLCQSEITSAITKENIIQKKIELNKENCMQKGLEKREQQGRWPSNLLLDEESAQELDKMTGILNPPGNKKKSVGNEIFGSKINTINQPGVNCYPGEFGQGASRFFYCAKASSSERNRGLEGMPLKECQTGCGGAMPIDDDGKERDRFKKQAQNFHPTVKPISLMKYIITLLAPPGNPILLDPFAGSGSTLIAAKELGIQAIGIEKEPEYAEIAIQRIKNWSVPTEQYELFK